MLYLTSDLWNMFGYIICKFISETVFAFEDESTSTFETS
jgi:hypothetical protein